MRHAEAFAATHAPDILCQLVQSCAARYNSRDAHSAHSEHSGNAACQHEHSLTDGKYV